MSTYQLYCFAESGNAYKAALMLELCGLDWGPVHVRYFDGETREPRYRETVNEMGEVPVLVTPTEKLSQSGVILDYLAEVTGQFGGQTTAEKREIWRWLLFDNHKFTMNYATLRFQYAVLKTGDTPVTAFLLGRARTAFEIVDRHLERQPFIMGDRPTIVDFSMVGYHYHDEPPCMDRRKEYPHLMAWVDRIAALPRWKGPYELMKSALPDVVSAAGTASPRGTRSS